MSPYTVAACTTELVYNGWVYRVGITGGYTGVAIPGYYQPPREEGLRQRSGPRKACRAWSGWSEGWARVPGCSAAGRPCTHPSGPVGPMLGPPWYRTSECRLWANKGEIKVHFLET